MRYEIQTTGSLGIILLDIPFHRLIHKQIGKQTPASLEFAGVCEKSGKKSRFVVIIL